MAIRVAARGAGGVVGWAGVFSLCHIAFTDVAKGNLRAGRTIEVTVGKDSVRHRVTFGARNGIMTETLRQMVLMRSNAAEFGIAIAIQVEWWSGLQNTRVRGHDSIRISVAGSTLIGLNGCLMVSIKATRSHQSLSRQKDERAHTEFGMLAFS